MRDGAAGHPGDPHPAGDPVREPEQLPQDHLPVVGVAGEGLVGAHRLVGLAADRAVGVIAAGRCPRPARAAGCRGGRPTARWRVRTGVWATSPTVIRPSRCSIAWVFSPTPHSSPTSSGCRNAVTRPAAPPPRRRAWPGGWPAWPPTPTRPRPTEQVMPCSSWIVGAQVLGDLRRRARGGGSSRVTSRNASSSETTSTSGVTRRKFSMHRGRDLAEGLEVGRDHHGLRAQPPGPGHRHRRADAVRPGEVVGREHHPAAAAADDHRDVGQVGPVAGRHGGVERVHVDVQDRGSRS